MNPNRRPDSATRSPYEDHGKANVTRQPSVARAVDARRPVFISGGILMAAVPAVFAAVWLVAGRDGSASQQSFADMLFALGLSSFLLGASAMGLVGFLRLVTGRRGLRPAFPLIAPGRARLSFFTRRAASVDLRTLWAPTLPVLAIWSAIGSLQPELPPAIVPLTLVSTGASFVLFLYFWGLGLLRVYGIGRRPSLALLGIGLLAGAAFLLPFLLSDPTRYPGLYPRRGIVLLGPSPERILPLA